MHDLTPLTALGSTTPRTDAVGPLTCTETPGLALASVHARLGQEDTCRIHLAELLNGANPPDPGHAHLDATLSAIWMGPDQWLLIAPFESHEDIAATTKERIGEAASVTEQTDAWCGFALTGADIEPMMELLCNIDIGTMAAGHAARTRIHQMGCFVIRHANDHLLILGPRASAASLHRALIAAMHAAAGIRSLAP